MNSVIKAIRNAVVNSRCRKAAICVLMLHLAIPTIDTKKFRLWEVAKRGEATLSVAFYGESVSFKAIQ